METQRQLYTFLVMKMPMYTPDLHTKLSRIRIGQSLPEPVNENVIAQFWESHRTQVQTLEIMIVKSFALEIHFVKKLH